MMPVRKTESREAFIPAATYAYQHAAPQQIPTDEVANCPVCSHNQFNVLTVGYDYELQTCANAWRFVRCAQCEHVWLNPRPALETLPIIYPSHYYAYNYRKQINPVAVWGKAVLDKIKLRGILRLLAARPQSYLDVGCGDGRYLRAMETAGVSRARLFGLELDERSARTLAAMGYQVRCKRVEDCTAMAENSLDLITMFHVIEHVDNPAAVVAKITRWLAPGGVFAVETPNLDSWDARLFKDHYWGGYHIPRHWNLFTCSSLKRLLQQNGLEVIDTRFQPGHSFWMYSLHHALRYGPKRLPRLAPLFNPFQNLPLLMLFTAFDKVRAALGRSTSSMLMLAQKKGSGGPREENQKATRSA